MNRDVEYRKTEAQISIEGRKVDAQIAVEKLKADSEISLARDKLDFDQKHDVKQFESTLILNATKPENIGDRIRNLRFFVTAGLLSDVGGKIMTLIEQGDVPISQNYKNYEPKLSFPDGDWVYSQSTGNIFHFENGVPVLHGSGYSGVGEDENNPSAQSHKASGPIPLGTYTIKEPTKFHEMNNVLGLSPDSGNEMFGRTDFVIQDGAFNKPNKMATDNSIALPEIRRIEIWRSGDHTLHVVR
jgi:hypothetical protein